MKEYKKLIIIAIVVVSLLLIACSNSNDETDKKVAGKDSQKVTKAKGGENLVSVRAEYTFCYDTGSYDPTLRIACESNITYKQCLEFKENQPGGAHTFFYAIFEGGEPTIPGRYANNYYMKVKYGKHQELKTDNIAAFQDSETEFKIYDLTDCYPKGTMELYNVNDELMGRMSYDYEIK